MSQLAIRQPRSALGRFFVRQFDLQRTRQQDRFDALFGVVLPVLCFEFDPIVFKGPLGPVAADYQGLVYTISAVEITTMVVWLMFRDRFSSFTGPIAGVLFFGGLFSLLIGVLLLPLSLIGLMLIVGIAGFTPFLTGIVYLRNGVRGFKSHQNNHAYGSRFSIGIASAVIVLALTIFVASRISGVISGPGF